MRFSDLTQLIFTTKKSKVIAPHLQWHLTDKCNLRCSHCYQDDYVDVGAELEKMFDILEQFKYLVLFFRGQGKPNIKGHITLTGGEPFVKKGFLELLIKINSQKEFFTYSILTNGTLIDKKWSIRLKQLKPKYIQVSLDGDKNKHDEIRGKGSFDKSAEAIKLLRAQDIRVLVSFTATKLNYLLFSSVSAICRALNVNFLWSDRLIPEGSAKSDSIIENKMLLNKEETNQFFKLMRHEADICKKDKSTVTRVRMHRALQFQYSNDDIYHCVAGETLITIMPNGDLYPCRRMPVKVGNIFENSLSKIYFESPFLRNLRDKSRTSIGCEPCEHNKTCRGGLKCLSYATYGDAYKKDPGCNLGKELV
jgi:radical SAM protein with 4Fe4S-binding SPASM domain